MRIFRVALPLLLAAMLLVGLVAGSGLSLEDFVATLRQISTAVVASFVACTAIFVALSALKWRWVMSHMTPAAGPAPSWIFSLYYTSLGTLLSLVITPHAAMPISRSLGTKLHAKGSAGAAAAASAYEQIFDVVLLVTMSVTALIAIILRSSFAGWLAIALVLNAAAFLGMLLVLRSQFWKVAEYIPLPQRCRNILLKKFEWFETPAARMLLGSSFVATLFAISVARYTVILVRTGLIIVAVGLPVSSVQFVKAYGVARLSSLISITPGELGINEWTWSGVLAWMGFGLDDAARFVLTNRLFNTAALILVFAILWLVFVFTRATVFLSSDERASEC